MSDIAVTNNADASRWEAHEGATLAGFADYVERDGVVVFTHTEVPEEFGGRGIAGQIVRTSLDDARARGRKVIPECEYYAGWVVKHPEYADLTASETAAPPLD